MSGKNGRLVVCVFALAGLLQITGCSRSMINYQIAESIGTLGMYENNEPVETPQMKMERELREQEESEETALTEILGEADQLALGYDYDGAIDLLQNAEIDRNDDRVVQAIADYQGKKDSLQEYQGDIPHLSFPHLIIDPERALGGESGYGDLMITLGEFESILDILYQNNYILIDIHDLAGEGKDEDGKPVMEQRNPLVPADKKPIVFSVDNLEYSQVQNGKGIATRLAIDKDGKVGAVYTDAEGHDLTGAYDVVPVLDRFVEQHPDFSFRGAKGIIGVTGENGAFGYVLEEDGLSDVEANRRTVQQIAQTLENEGWGFACEGYSYTHMENYSYEALTEDITHWKTAVGQLLGDVDTLIFPYGSEVDFNGDGGKWLIKEGFCYFVGLWPQQDFREVKPTYLLQTRRMLNGYVFREYPDIFSTFFDVASILDESRS